MKSSFETDTALPTRCFSSMEIETCSLFKLESIAFETIVMST